MIYCFDLDGTICTNTNGSYENAEPFYDRIKTINELYDQGNTIIINTARGYTTGINWTDLTIKQLHEWKINYHELYVGTKINADFYIDDKAINDKDFFKL